MRKVIYIPPTAAEVIRIIQSWGVREFSRRVLLAVVSAWTDDPDEREIANTEIEAEKMKDKRGRR